MIEQKLDERTARALQKLYQDSEDEEIKLEKQIKLEENIEKLARAAREIERVECAQKRNERQKLLREIAKVLNRSSRESKSGTPDFVLSDVMVTALESFENATKDRADWRADKSPRWDVKGMEND